MRRAAFALFLLASSQAATCQDGRVDTLFLVGDGMSLRGRIVAIRPEGIEMETAEGTVIVERRFVTCLRRCDPAGPILDEDFERDTLGANWKVTAGDWKIDDEGWLVGDGHGANASLSLAHVMSGDVEMEFDAEMLSAGPNGWDGIHATMGGQNFYYYCDGQAGIYPPYERGSGGVLNRKYRLRLARRDGEFTLLVDGEVVARKQARDLPDSTPVALCAAHGGVVRFDNLKVWSRRSSPVLAGGEGVRPEEAVLHLATGESVHCDGVFAFEDGVLTVSASVRRRRIALDDLVLAWFPRSRDLEFEFGLPDALARRIEDRLAMLGAEDWADREAAVGDLVELGVLAVPGLRKALLSEDEEVSIRARHALEGIGARSR